MTTLRVAVADDERPARRFLTAILRGCKGVELIGEAASGKEAVELIETKRPDLALLDLQMPDGTGLDVVRQVRGEAMPFIAFVTAFDDYAVEAFELNAIDYLLKPIQAARLQATIDRVREQLKRAEPAAERAATLVRAATAYERASQRTYIDRIPVRKRDAVEIVSVRQIACIVADGEFLNITTIGGEMFTITHRLHALEARLDPRRFVRLGRGTLANIELITRVTPMPGGTYVALLSTGQELPVSRIQSRLLRETLLKL